MLSELLATAHNVSWPADLPTLRVSGEVAWHDLQKAVPAAIYGICHLQANVAASR
jgi:hypothetical protein